ncbi:MAG TPA: hypothetical protein VK866_17825, partial [Acidimicrobiales bacterium]|nr:hypothetical protein [Acidimicrobiales bacterium]
LDEGRTLVTATVTGLRDDSTAALRYEIVWEDVDGGHRLAEGELLRQCAEGRGHQDFSLEPCL